MFTRPEIIRPPSEWRSYYLPLTHGCSNSTCTFCNFYGTEFQIRDLEDVKQEIDALSLYMKQGIVLNGIPNIVYALASRWDGKRIFLQDGDALVYPVAKLKEVLHYINQTLPHVDRIAAYATAQDILKVDASDLEELRDLKLGILYIGENT
jgi:2-iminoacetate synthase ThiH